MFGLEWGDLVVTSTREQVYRVYRELLALSFYVQIIIAFGLLVLAQDFIALWLGEEYVLAPTILYLLVACLTLGAFTNTNTCFLAAYRLFNDAWISIVEACLTVGLGILFAFKFGVFGVVGGMLAGIFLLFLWKPYYLYRKVFPFPLISYFLIVGKMFFFSIIIYLGVNQWIVSPLKDWLNVSNLGEWFVWALGSTSVYAVVLGIFLYIFDTGFSTFVKRFISIRRKV